DCQLQDRGEISAVVGQDETTANLDVKDIPVNFTKRLTDQNVMEHKNAKFTCETSVEDVEVDWFVKGEQVKESQKYSIYEDGVTHMLVIHDVLIGDSAQVTARVSQFESTAYLYVKAQPVEFTRTLEDQSVAENTTASFTCEVSKPANVQWFVSEVEVTQGSKYEIDMKGLSHSLT
ncbi:unnamed protein product, partial [Owenia fusiformis]